MISLIVGIAFISTLGWYSILAVNDWYEGNATRLHWYFDVAYVLSVFMAFIAAGLGSRARLKIEGNPLLMESFFTPLQDRDYLAAIHRNLLIVTAFGIIPPLIFGGLMSSSFFWADYDYLLMLDGSKPNLLPFESIAFRPFSYLCGYRFTLMDNAPNIGWLFSAAAIVCVINWGVGFYLHGLVLAQVSHHKPGARMEGGFMTISLMFILITFMIIRFAIIPFGLLGMIGTESLATKLMLYFMVMESIVITLRLLGIRLIWKRMLRDGFMYSRLKYFGQ